MSVISNMSCSCTNLPDLFKLETYPDFILGTVRVATGYWVHLHKCTNCDQLWRLDEWDKYQSQFVVRIPSNIDWTQFDATSLQKQFLVQSRGGLSQELCGWHGCQSKCVNGVAYCVEHFYQTGARE